MNLGLFDMKVCDFYHMTLLLKANEQYRDKAKSDIKIIICRLLICLGDSGRCFIEKPALKCIIRINPAVVD